MQQINITLQLVIFRIDNDSLCVFVPHGHIPTEIISEKALLNDQIETMFQHYTGFPLGTQYVEQLYTFADRSRAAATSGRRIVSISYAPASCPFSLTICA